MTFSAPRDPSGRNPPTAAKQLPRDGEVFPTTGWKGYGRPGVPAPGFVDRIRNASASFARLETLLDIAATRRAGVRREWSDETELSYLTAVLSHRR